MNEQNNYEFNVNKFAKRAKNDIRNLQDTQGGMAVIQAKHEREIKMVNGSVTGLAKTVGICAFFTAFGFACVSVLEAIHQAQIEDLEKDKIILERKCLENDIRNSTNEIRIDNLERKLKQMNSKQSTVKIDS